jgi:hypothetical protein
MTYATYDDLKEVEPNIDEYGVLEWDIELERSSLEINRVLKVRWYTKFQRLHPSIQTQDLDPSLLDSGQWRMATIYHALAYHISPKLTKFVPETDKFQIMMEYYQGRFEHEMDLCLREGVRYDVNDDGEISRDEQRPVHNLRLKR